MGSYRNIAIIEKDSESCQLFANAVHEASLSANTHCFCSLEELMYGVTTTELPDIIFLEINLDKGNGFNALQHFRTTRGFKDIPIIIFSNSRDLQDIAELYILGASRYLIKPVQYPHFLEVLQQIINRQIDVLEESDYDNFIITT